MIDHRVNRRGFIAGSALASSIAMAGEGIAASTAPLAEPEKTRGELGWLDGAPPGSHEGQTWGQPWPRGSRYSRTGYRMMGAEQDRVAVQSWPLAWWPDGSIKWTGHAVPANTVRGGPLALRPAAAVVLANPISVRENADAVEVQNGDVLWRIPRSGAALIASASAGGREVMRDVGLTATAQDRPEDDGVAPRLDTFSGTIEQVSVEQSGPVRAVIKIDGKHLGTAEGWLAFSLRLYFYAGSASVRIVHSVIFDGDPEKRFIRGLGLSGAVPMHDAPHDRHVRFGGERGGLWGEAVRPLTGLRRDPGAAFRTAQIAGQPVPPLSQLNPVIRDELRYIPAWGDFTLSQPNADGFTITKRTNPGRGWIDVDTAGRAPGFGYVGGASGGVAFGMADFWQRCPVRLDIRDAAADIARFTIWYHSPDAPAMDLRFYHDEMGMTDFYHQNLGLDITYEDYEPGWGTSQGIARTTEFRLWALPATPSRERLAAMAGGVSHSPRLLPTPARVREAGMFGIWGATDRSTPALAKIEDRAKRELDFYAGQVDQRRWYGFWNYGDIQHSYDNDRHVWRYDIGGFAWDNSELSSDLWLWYGYLRTGRADVFRMAEAMTHHTSEVDVYHSGRFKGLGTRHGVQHWGDSSKQPRIANAAYRRFYFYLTGDERAGDLMRALIDSDQVLNKVEIERKVGSVTLPATPAAAPPAGQVRMSFGTVWGSLIAAWLTEWERTGDTHWRDRIVAGMNSIAALPKQWFAGYANYDLATGRFTGPGDTVQISHLNGAFGVFEMHAELLELINVPAYREAWLDYCQYYNAPAAEFTAKTGAAFKDRGLRQGHSRFTAFAAVKRNDPKLAQRAWAEFMGQGDREERQQNGRNERIAGAAVLKPIDEIVEISTNDAAQWGLAAGQNIAMIGKLLTG